MYKSRMKRINHSEKENFYPSFGIVQFICKTFCIRRRFILHLILLIQTRVTYIRQKMKIQSTLIAPFLFFGYFQTANSIDFP